MRMMELKDVIYAKEDGIAAITINRPEALNALTIGTIPEMRSIERTITSTESIP